MKGPQAVIIKPVITEKTTTLSQGSNVISFRVAKDANKIEIRKAVETLFNVKVVEVRVLNMHGKQRRFGRYNGRRPDWRKAYVRLAAGEKTIEFFDQV